MTEEAALDILRERRGRMYDPDVVDTFIAVYRTIGVETPGAAHQSEVLKRISDSQSESRLGPEVSQAAQAVASSSDVLAFVSLSRLARGEATVSDVLSLSSSLIRDVVPGATGAWYLPNPTNDALTVVDAFGPAAEALIGASVGFGERLTGWVAATRQPVIDSDAALDLDGSFGSGSPDLERCTSVPLLLGTSLVGVMSVYSPQGGCDQNRGRLLEMIAPHVASALHAAKSVGRAHAEAAAMSSAAPTQARDSQPALVH
jgi:GAF domain-containing protein